MSLIHSRSLVVAPEPVLGNEDEAHKDTNDDGSHTDVGHGVTDLSLQVLEAAISRHTNAKVERVVEETGVAHARALVLTLEEGDDLHAEFQSRCGGHTFSGFRVARQLSFNFISKFLVALLEVGVLDFICREL